MYIGHVYKATLYGPKVFCGGNQKHSSFF
jgi:hypothetical protein